MGSLFSPIKMWARASGTIHCVSERFDFTGDELAPAYRAAVDAIEAGDLVVLPTDTVYGIAADAFKADAVQRLLDAKGRGRDMPPPVLISVCRVAGTRSPPTSPTRAADSARSSGPGR